MIQHPIAVGIGVAVGVVAVVIAYKVYSDKKTQRECNQTSASEKSFAEQLEKEKQAERKIEELISKRTFVDVLTIQELTNWFREKKSQYPNSPKMIISTPDEKTMRGLGYKATTEMDLKSNILQFFYDDNSKTVLDIRIVGFNEIESTLEAQLLEHDGMIVLTD